jgi:hypothetical protein
LDSGSPPSPRALPPAARGAGSSRPTKTQNSQSDGVQPGRAQERQPRMATKRTDRNEKVGEAHLRPDCGENTGRHLTVTPLGSPEPLGRQMTASRATASGHTAGDKPASGAHRLCDFSMLPDPFVAQFPHLTTPASWGSVGGMKARMSMGCGPHKCNCYHTREQNNRSPPNLIQKVPTLGNWVEHQQQQAMSP